MSVFSTGVPMGGYTPMTGTAETVQNVQKMSQQVRDLQQEIRDAKKKKANSSNDNDQSTKVFSPTDKSTSAVGGLRGSFTA